MSILHIDHWFGDIVAKLSILAPINLSIAMNDTVMQLISVDMTTYRQRHLSRGQSCFAMLRQIRSRLYTSYPDSRRVQSCHPITRMDHGSITLVGLPATQL